MNNINQSYPKTLVLDETEHAQKGPESLAKHLLRGASDSQKNIPAIFFVNDKSHLQ